jgi:hypothetical protein
MPSGGVQLRRMNNIQTAHASGPDPLLADLSRCDSTFFAALGRRTGEFRAHPHFRKRGRYGYFQVLDRTDMEASRQWFQTPLPLGSLQAIGYFDEAFDIGEAGQFIAWGFLLLATVEETVLQLKSHIWQAQRLRKIEPVYLRSELWHHAQEQPIWEIADTQIGPSPRPGTVERLLMVEPYEEDARLTRFGCSLQGAITQDMLKSERPDLRLA